ncbi:MAG: glycerophosphoryl diester phosphodiesterase membrane domain-containing protein [Sporichthyaceae bacterium]
MSGPPEETAPDPDRTPWPSGAWAADQPAAWTKPSLQPPPPPPPPGYPPPGYPPPAYPPAQGWAPPPGAPLAWTPPPAGAPAPAWGPPGPPPAARPGVIPLRPLGLGELLDGAVSTMRKHWRVQLGITAVVVLAVTVIQGVGTWMFARDSGMFDENFFSTEPLTEETDAFGSGGAQLVQGVGIVFGLVAQLALAGLLTVVVGRAVLGRDVSTREVWAQVRPRAWQLVGLALLLLAATFGLVLFAVLFPVGLWAAGVPDVAALALGAVLVLLAIPVAVWLWVRFAVAAPAMVLERTGVRAALRRSARLVRRSWWRTFGILLLIQLMGQVISGMLAMPFMIAAFAMGFLVDGGATSFFVMLMVGGAVGSLVTYPFTAGVTALMYVDLRMRREGLDLALARSTGDPAVP